MTAGENKFELPQLIKDAFVMINIEDMNGFHYLSSVDDSLDLIFTDLINKNYDVKRIALIDTQAIIIKLFMLRI